MDRCGCGDDFASIFDRATAESDRDRYRRHGPDGSTRLLIDMLLRAGVRGASLLDVGGGIGVIAHELLREGAGRAVLVDAAPAYLEVARQEARVSNLLERVEFVDGDFVRRAGAIDAADIVTLDRVICCYPDAEALVSMSAARARRLYGLVLPRDAWYVRLAIRLNNLRFRIARRAYRSFAHPNGLVDGLVAAAGLRPIGERRTLFWRVVLYERAA